MLDLLGFVPQPNLLRNYIFTFLDSSLPSINLTVWHDGFVENNILIPIEVFSPSQIGITQIDISQTSFDKVSTFEDGTSEIGIYQASLPEVGIAEVSPFHQTMLEHSFVQTNISELSEAEIGFFKTTPIKMGIGKVSFSVDPWFKDLIEPLTSKTPSSEVPVSPSSVLSHQFFSIHDSTPQIIDSLNNTTNRWLQSLY
jgi:hypothetical protein